MKVRYLSLLALWLLTSCAQQTVAPLVISGVALNPETETKVIQSPKVRLVSFNIAHGRRDSFSQTLLGADTIRDNLTDLATYLEGTQADIVALQEADGPSPWSGNFDHVAFVAKRAGFAHHARAEHVTTWWGDYGTGLLSRHPFTNVYGHTFKPSPPTTRKGFTLATVWWQAAPLLPPMQLDIVSLHLDFARETIRRRQIQELVTVLEQRHNPVVIMGDFNSEAIASQYLPSLFANKTQLKTYDQSTKRFSSFGNKKLDWIVLSEELEFVEYYVDEVSLSDHRPVIVDVRLASQETLTTPMADDFAPAALGQ